MQATWTCVRAVGSRVEKHFRMQKTRQVCSKNGHVVAVRILVEAGANGDLQDQDDKTALLHAACAGHVETVRMLEAGADKDLRDVGEFTALMHAASAGRTENAHQLLETGAREDFHDQSLTALMLAAGGGHVTVVEMQAGAEKDMVDYYHRTAVMYAAGNGEVEGVRLLLEAGADENMQDQNGKAASERARARSRIEVVSKATILHIAGVQAMVFCTARSPVSEAFSMHLN